MTPMRFMAECAARGKLALQTCGGCGRVQYPPRELCGACLADRFEWRTTDSEDGKVLAATELHHSHDAAFRANLPVGVGLVQLDCGPVVVCILAADCNAGMRVRIAACSGSAGRAVLTAAPIA
jgi:uncharacterized OB-fold protein